MKVLSAKSDRSNIGRDWRSWPTMKIAMSAITAPSRARTIGLTQPRALPSISTYIKTKNIAVKLTRPTLSSFFDSGSRDSRALHCVSASSGTQIGIIDKKIQRQPRPSVISPPINGPKTAPAQTMTPQIAKARMRSLPWKS